MCKIGNRRQLCRIGIGIIVEPVDFFRICLICGEERFYERKNIGCLRISGLFVNKRTDYLSVCLSVRLFARMVDDLKERGQNYSKSVGGIARGAVSRIARCAVIFFGRSADACDALRDKRLPTMSVPK